MNKGRKSLRATTVFIGGLALLAGVVSRADASADSRSLGSAALQVQPASGEVSASDSELRGVIERFIADKKALERYLPFSFSALARTRFKGLIDEWSSLLDRVDFAALDMDGGVDFHLLRTLLAREQKALNAEAKAEVEAAPLLPFAAAIIGLREDLLKFRWTDPRSAARVLGDLEKQVLAARASWESRPPATPVRGGAAARAFKSLTALRDGLKEWCEFYDGYDPLFTWWAAAPYRAADAAIQDYLKALGELRSRPSPDDPKVGWMPPVSRDDLLRELALEWIPYTPEEILAMGWQELAWCERERAAATRELGYGDDWRKAIEHVKSRAVEPGRQAELVRALAMDAVDFLESRDCLTIPPLVKEAFRIRMMPLDEQLVTPFFTGGEVVSVAYPMNTMPFDQKEAIMRGNNPHFSKAVVHHELIPGHHLQMFMAERHKPYRDAFQTNFFVEGWPLYWEMRLWDMGYPSSPEDRIGMLFWRMHRCGRIIFSMSYHLGRMSGPEAIDFLVERVGHERDNAAVEVTRSLGGGYPPLSQISYLVGGLQLRALSRELVDSGRMTAKAFHDAALREGSIPVELLRAKLAGRKLSPDSTPSWKFYEFAGATAAPIRRKAL
jgi:hypothetical protein